MLTFLIETLLSPLLVESFREEAIGDLWEGHYRLKVQNRSIIVRSIYIFMRIMCLVYASIRIFREESKQYNSKIYDAEKTKKIVFGNFILLVSIFSILTLNYMQI